MALNNYLSVLYCVINVVDTPSAFRIRIGLRNADPDPATLTLVPKA